VLTALLDLANEYTRSFGLGPPSATVRILLATSINLLFAAVNVGGGLLYFRAGRPSKAASLALLVLGAIALLYVPIWSLGLPGLTQLLSTRWNPLTRVIFRGGLHSLLSLESAIVFLAGIGGAATRHQL
jgi:hypothetical protein